MNIPSKNSIYLLPILLILLFAGNVSALPTTAHGTVNGEMYVSSTANWPSKYTTNNFDVPNGTVVFARYYVGVWASSSLYESSISTTFNGHAFPTNPSYYSSEMGVTWIPYDVTDYLQPDEKNTATINSASWGDGRQYGSTLVVVLKNESKPQMEYWIADGLDWLHYAEYLGYAVDSSFTYFNGTVDLANVQSASLYSTHLTGYNYEDFNGKSFSDPTDSTSGDYFNYIRWDNVKPSLVAENQTVNVGRGDDTYCSPAFHALSIVYEKKPDLVPVNLTPTTVVPNTSNTMTATIENQGDKDSTAFNVSLLVDDTIVDAQTVANLTSGSSTTVDFHWTPYGTKNSYSLTVNIDSENAVNETNESNNLLTSLVGITTAPVPVADFAATLTNGDAPLTVSFTDNSTNSPTSWAWDFNNDGVTDSTEQNPTYIYNTPGTYTVNLTVANAGGRDSNSKTSYITVNPLVADFTASPISGGIPLTVNFTDQSTGTPTSWAWDFENDGSVDSTQQNPTYIYSTPGNYTVNLTVTNIGGTNSTVKADYITVSSSTPVADFTVVPTKGSTPLTVQFTDQSKNLPSEWFWDFGDGTTSTEQNPIHTYTTIGTYTVNLTVTNIVGINTTTKTGYITVQDVATSGPTWAAKSEWNGPSTNTYSAPCLADLDGDGDYDLLVGRQDGYTYGYENTGTTNSPVWTRKTEWDVPNIGDYAAPCLVDLDGDGDYDLLIGEKVGKTYAYENTGNKSSPMWTKKTEWDLADMGSYAVPSFADLDNDGDYDILISAMTGIPYAFENTGTTSSPVWTRNNAWNAPDPSEGKDYSSPCLADLDGDGDYDLFVGTKTGNSYAYKNTGTTSSPEWTRNDAWNVNVGSYAASRLADLDSDGDYDLLIGTSGGSIYAYENTAIIAAKPDLTPTIVTPPSVVNTNTPCTISSTINNTGTENVDAFNVTLSVNGTVVDTQPVSGIASGSSALVNFSWTPEVAGDYNLTVTADPENGISESDETNNALTVLVTASSASTTPIANFTADITSGTAPLTVNFTDQSTGSPTSWLWDFGDGTNTTEQNASHTYTSTGNYTVNLTVSNAGGNDTEVKTKYILVSESLPGAPVANFTANVTNGTVPLTVEFTDISTGSPTSWQWDFNNDGTVDSTEQAPIYTYSTAGNYTVNLTVANAGGNDSEVKTEYIVVSEPLPGAPVANFTATPTSGTAPLTVNFTDQSTGTVSSYSWDFNNDGNVDSTEQSPSYTYGTAGTYTVNLTVIGPGGSDSEVKTGYIKVTVSSPGKPVAAFSASPASGKTPLTVTFTDTSTGAPTKWKWSFGDGASSTIQNPKHKYSAAGKYTVTLTVSNVKGSNTVTETDYIKVIAKPVSNFTSSVTSGKAPLNVVFTDTSTGTASSWIWDFGDGSKSFVQNPKHKYSKVGTYTVILTVKNAVGSNTVTKTDYIKVTEKPVAEFSASPASGKTPLTVAFSDTSTGLPTKWKWNFGDGTSSTIQNPKHKYSKAGSYTVTLTATNAAGSSKTTKTNYIKITA